MQAKNLSRLNVTLWSRSKWLIKVKKPSLFSSLDGVWCSNWFMVTIGEWVVHRCCWCCCCGGCGCGVACSPELVDHGVLNLVDKSVLVKSTIVYRTEQIPVVTLRIVSWWSKRLGQGAFSNRCILFTTRHRITILSGFQLLPSTLPKLKVR